jgi:hypothetical protein
MTPRQKRIIGALAIANGLIILTLIVFLTRFSGPIPSAPLPTPVPTYPSGALSSQECQQRAVQMVSQAGLAGTATVIPGESLRLELVYPMAPGESLASAAQQVWTAFDIAIALTENRCDIVSRVEVQIEPRSRGAQGLTQIRASVDVADLKAFHSGKLSESEFIDQVQYKAGSSGRQ